MSLQVHLGIEDLLYSSIVEMGGASSVAGLQSAIMAVNSGEANYVLMPFGWNGYSVAKTSDRERPDAPARPDNQMFPGRQKLLHALRGLPACSVLCMDIQPAQSVVWHHRLGNGANSVNVEKARAAKRASLHVRTSANLGGLSQLAHGR